MPVMKKWKHYASEKKWKHYASDEEVKTAELKWLKEQSKEFYEAEIHALIRRWNIAIGRNRDYVEK